MSMRHRVGFLFVLCLSGCGISDYTGQITSEKAVVDYWDKENRLLGKKITMPTFAQKEDKDAKDDKDKKPPEWKVFLRLPIGISESPTLAGQDKKDALVINSVLVQYSRFNNRFGIQNVYLGVSNDAKDFAKNVYEALHISPGAAKLVVPPITRSPTLAPTGTGKSTNPNPDLNFTRCEVVTEPTADYSFNFYQRDKTQVAIVFQMDKGKLAGAADAITFSLATVGVGSDTYPFGEAYSKRNKPPKKK